MPVTAGEKGFWFLACLAAFLLFALAAFMGGGEEAGRSAPIAPALPSEVEVLNALEEAAESSRFFVLLVHAFLLAVFAGIAIDVRFVWRRLRGRGGLPPPRGGAEWTAVDVAAVIAVFLAVFFAAHAAVAGGRLLRFGASEVSVSVAIQFVAELAAVIVLFRILPRPLSRAARTLGLRGGGALGHVAAGIGCYIGFLPVLIALTWLTERAADRLGIPLQPQEQIGLFFADLSAPALFLLVCFVVFVGPVFEEIFFRGFAYQALRDSIGRWPGILVSAALFSALHASLAVFLPILGLGVFLAYVFEARGSLLPSITVHVCQNGVAVAGALLVRFLSGA
ncbi:MAG: type II CAAX endopeptidase family protein [bacterium]|nr:type II CAAX endopeptidase family protein [bacterium]